MLNLDYRTIMYNIGCHDSRLRVICRAIEKIHGPFLANAFIFSMTFAPGFPSFSLKQIITQLNLIKAGLAIGRVHYTQLYKLNCPFICLLDLNPISSGDYALVEALDCSKTHIRFANESNEITEMRVSDLSAISSGITLMFSAREALPQHQLHTHNSLFEKKEQAISKSYLGILHNICSRLPYITRESTETSTSDKIAKFRLGFKCGLDIDDPCLAELNSILTKSDVAVFSKVDAAECIRLQAGHCTERRFDGGVNLGRKILMITMVGDATSVLKVNLSACFDVIELKSGDLLIIKIGNEDGRLEWRTDWSSTLDAGHEAYIIVHWGI